MRSGGASMWGEAAKGYCLGLVSVWLAQRARGKDFAVDPATYVVTDLDQASDPLLQLSATSFNTGFAMLGDPKAPRDADKRLDFGHEHAYRVAGMRSVEPQTKVWYAAPKADWIVHNVSRRAGQYVVVLRGHADAHGELPQHMLGIDLAGDLATVRFFDPNGGGYIFASTTRFEKWLDGYLVAMGYTTYFAKRTMVAPLKPLVGKGQELMAFKLYFQEIGQAMADQAADGS